MSKITLTNLANLQNESTAVNAINSNSAVITTAFDNTLSRDGTAPNQMAANIDMNSNRILNLPGPGSLLEPLRLTDANTLNGGGTITVPSTASQLPFVPGGTVSSTNVQAAILEVAAEAGGTGNYVAPFTGSVSRTGTSKWADVISVKDFGALGDQSHDDTVAIQAAIDAAANGSNPNAAVYFPRGFYRVIGSGSQIFNITLPVKLYGDGHNSTIFLDPTVPSTRDLFRFAPTSQQTGWYIQDMNLAMNGFGRHAIHFDTSGSGAVHNARINGLLISASAAGYSIKTTNATVGDGLAYSAIENCNLNCISLDNCADGVVISRCVIGTDIVGQRAIRASFVAGAGGFVVENNVIGTKGGFIYLDNGSAPTIKGNFLETPSGFTNPTTAMIDLGITGTLSNAQILDNSYTVQPGNAATVPLRFRGNCTGGRVDDNRVIVPTGGVHIQIDTSASDISINRACQFITNNVVGLPTITDNGTRTGYTSYYADGSVGAPSVSFLNNKDSGFYRVGSNSIGLSISGVNMGTFSAASGSQFNTGFSFGAGGATFTAGGGAAVTGSSTSSNALTVGPSGATNPTLQVDSNTASSATGIKIKSAAAGNGIAVSAISSGSNENLTIDAKGTGTLTLQGTATGATIASTIAGGTAAASALTLKATTAASAGAEFIDVLGGIRTVALTSISNASPAVFTLAFHGLAVGDSITLTTTGSLPTGLTVGTTYYVISAGLTLSAFEVSTTPGGAAVNTSSAGSGTHSFSNNFRLARFTNSIAGLAAGISIGTTTTAVNGIWFANPGGGVQANFGADRSASGAGMALNFTSSGAQSGGSNLAGGNIVFQSGTSTGSGTSSLQFNAYPGTAAATTDNTPAVVMKVNAVSSTTGNVTIAPNLAIPASGSAGTGVMFSSTANFGVFFGSGSPHTVLTAAKGSLYLRSNGSTTNDRMFVNTDGGTSWTAVTTVA